MPKGYFAESDYYGLVDGEYMPFVNDTEYLEFLKERKEENEYNLQLP